MTRGKDNFRGSDAYKKHITYHRDNTQIYFMTV